MDVVPGAHGHSASDIVGELHQFSTQVNSDIAMHILQHPFERTLYLFLPDPHGAVQLAHAEELSDAELLHEAPVGAVRGGDEPRIAVREPLGEGEGGSGRESDVVGLEDFGGGGGGGDEEEAARGAEAEVEEGAVVG